MNTTIYIGNIVHCPKPFTVQVLERGFVIVQNGKVAAIDNEFVLQSKKSELHLTSFNTIVLTKSQILIPGLIDTHIHAPQYPNCGLGYDMLLLDWLDTYTYKLEKQYKDLELSEKVYNALVRKTLDHGTTTALYFASMFSESSKVLVNSTLKFGQRALVGKINMTRLAPDDYRETPEESLQNTKDFISFVKGKNSELVQPVITPRFAPSVELDLMKKLGQLALEENLHIQSHISENKAELQLVKELFSSAKHYAHVYNDANLLTAKTVLAHGVHLTDEELVLLAEKQTAISHCPASNTCLKSGLCDVRRLLVAGIKVGLGTDVAGGPSPSIVEAMRAALDTSIHISYKDETYKPLTYNDVFYLATLGGAQALALDAKVGNFDVGKDFDALIVNMNVDNGNVDYVAECTANELLQKFIYVGDDRNIERVFVAGKMVKGRRESWLKVPLINNCF